MASRHAAQDPIQRVTPYQWFRLVRIYILIPILLFACAWDLRWWQAWAYSLLILLAGIAGHVLAERRHPGLLAERLDVTKALGVKPWDKVLALLMGIGTTFVLVLVAGLDHRFGWSPTFPLWLNLLGLLLTAAGYAFTGWAVAENRFFASFVRTQTDRGHLVCDTGPYRIVRHPGYAGLLLTLPGIVLALSSVWAVIPAAGTLIVIVMRTALEDRTLQEELPGYRDHVRRVHYRLIPRIY